MCYKKAALLGLLVIVMAVLSVCPQPITAQEDDSLGQTFEALLDTIPSPILLVVRNSN